MAKLSVSVCGVNLKNPLIAASGTYGFGREYNEIYDISLIGGISTKGMTLEPRLGNPVPRIAEGKSVILNAVGLQNPGADHFIKYDLPFLKEKNVAIVANVAGKSFDDYGAICAKLDGLVDFVGTDLHNSRHADRIDAYLLTKQAHKHAATLEGKLLNDRL